MSCGKLGLPVAERTMLVRGRLLERLRTRWFTPVTVLTAPAGYGKTTLLTQAIAANAAAPLGIDCWLACGPDTTTASSLAEGLCRAVDTQPPAAARAGVEEVAAAVSEAMWRRSPQQVCLDIDDVHEIPAGSEAAELLAAVVAAVPENGHVVLAGRVPPPLPLARLEVEGRVTRLDETDLAFTGEELTEFATLRGVPDSSVAACGGWPALAELSANARSGVTDDYIGEEVLCQLPPARRRDLALLAHVGSFDDDLARAVLGHDRDVADLVAGIPLLTIRGDGERTLHSLWRSLLAHEVTPAEVAGAQRRAAATLLRRGRSGAAVRLLIDAEAWDELTQAIVHSLGAARPPVPRDVMADWLARLPPNVRVNLGGRLLTAVVTTDVDPEGAWQRFEDCAAEFRALGDAAGELACLVHLGELAWWTEWPERLGAVAMRFFELEAAGSEDAVPLACVVRALLYDIQNDSRRVLGELDRIPPGSLSDMWVGVVHSFRATALMHLGNAQGAVETTERSLAHAAPIHAPMIEATKLQSLWFQGRIADVLEALPDLLRRFEASGYRHQISMAAAQCCMAYALQGRRDEAAGYLAVARANAASDPAPLLDTVLSLAEAALAVARGDEFTATTMLAACVVRHPPGQGLSAGSLQRSLALLYVLVPDTRPAWDRADLGPAFAVARDLARALTAVREGRELPNDVPPFPATGVVRAHLPLHWLAQLAVAAIAAGREDGSRLLEETWPATRPAVGDLARRSSGPLRKAARATLGRLAVPPSGRLELRLLGPLELRRDGAPVDAPDWRRERVRSLLAYLALHGTSSREKLANDLWPALDSEAQSRNLRVTLTYLLRVLEPERGQRDASFFVRHHGNNISLHPAEWLTVDIWDFDACCERVRDADRQGSPSTALEQALRAIELWRGEATELVSEPWAVILIEQRRLRFAAVATRAGELLLARGDADHARKLAEQVLTIDPWLEAAHRLVVATHRAVHDNLAARRALGRYREAIRELGLSPDETTLMVERLLDPGGPYADP